MGTGNNIFLLQTHFVLMIKSFTNEFPYSEMVGFASSFWVSLCNYILSVFGFIIRYFLRFQVDENFSGSNPVYRQETRNDFRVPEAEDGCRNETKEFSFKFQLPNRELSNGINGETGDSAVTKAACTAKYQFLSGNSFSGFMEGPEIMSFIVQESFSNSKKTHQGLDFREEESGICEEKTARSVQSFNSEEIIEKHEQLKVHEQKFLVEEDDFPDGSESVSDDVLHPISDHKIDEFCISDWGKGCEVEYFPPITDSETEITTESPSLLEISSCDEFEDSDSEYIELNPSNPDEHEQEDLKIEVAEIINNLVKSNEPVLEDSEEEEESESDILLEHRILIEQLKMDLRNVKASKGLPTILEESESPKMADDLKPLKIEEKKFEHKDRMNEIQKFYKSYAEKMRKLDVLSYQTTYAYSVLQLKDSVRQKSSSTTVKSLIPQNFLPCKIQDSETDPMMKFIIQFRRDWEIVYIGQLCLSWEILHWQYRKALELQDYDPQGFRRYNLVAGEFQQFQVLLQRFLEDEPFQGPRVQNYVRNRCVLRKLLQVPALKDDCSRGRREIGNDAISISMLREIIEESMRLFWEFLRVDKVASVKNVELQDPADLELMTNIQTNLQKKEKKLKEILRSTNCIVKKFQKHNEDGSAFFFAQVEIRLVSRVLHMMRFTTDQLLWCDKKLNKINFVNRRIFFEPTYLLFPC